MLYLYLKNVHAVFIPNAILILVFISPKEFHTKKSIPYPDMFVFV